MKLLLFYEKPGCATNARQKQILRRSGIGFEARSLLDEPWTAMRLRGFFGALPVVDWFNRAAPRVKGGEVDPARLDADTALALMLADPLLIRRPLLEGNGWRSAGFDWEAIAARCGVPAALAQQAVQAVSNPLEGCSHGDNAHGERCANPAESGA